MSRDLNKYAVDYSNSEYEQVQASFRRQKVMEILNQFQAKNILEIGCGLKSIFYDYKSYETVTILEPIQDFIQQNQEKYGPLKNSNWICTRLEDYNPPADLNKFDFIICSSLLHEINDPSDFLKKIYRLSSSETMIHVNVPNAQSLHRLLAVHMGLLKSIYEPSATAKHFQRKNEFSLKSLIHLLTENMFIIESSGSFLLKPFSNQQMQFLMQQPQIFPPSLFAALYSISEEVPTLGSEIYVNMRKKNCG